LSENATALRDQLEKCARRFHALRQLVGAAEHKHWKFEYCPAESCTEARAALEKVFGATRETGSDG
jgi:hypothetical protein